MLKSVYDTNSDNIVDHAALADAAPWTGITGKPATFPPDATAMLKSVYDTNNDGISDHAALADAAPWTGITGKPATFVPSVHETTHLDNGSDAIPLATTARTGLSPQVPSTNPTKQFHRGDNTYAAANYPDLTNIPTSFAPSAHAPSHVTGGADIIPVVTSSATGLVPTLPADTTKFLRGDGTFARNAVSTNSGNLATLGSDNLILVPQSSIWSARLLSFQALGNPTFEVDQIHVGTTVALYNVKIVDRWFLGGTGPYATTCGQQAAPYPGVILPGTNFALTGNFFRVTLTGQELTPAAGDNLQIWQTIEGSQFRELCNDVHSISVLVRSSVAGLKFCIYLQDAAGSTTTSLVNLCTIPNANTWTLIPLANLPVFPSAGHFSIRPGNASYYLGFTLMAGSTYLAPAAGTFQSGAFLGLSGMTNFCASPVNSTFDIAFVQHEPGAVCSTPMDCPFTDNLDSCQRYFSKSYPYLIKPGTASTTAGTPIFAPIGVAATPNVYGAVFFPKPMAKVPTVVGYSPVNGTANTVTDGLNGGDRTITGSVNVGDKVFGGFTVTGQWPSGTPWYFFHYTADTGW
jgi:hypothetical protein